MKKVRLTEHEVLAIAAAERAAKFLLRDSRKESNETERTVAPNTAKWPVIRVYWRDLTYTVTQERRESHELRTMTMRGHIAFHRSAWGTKMYNATAVFRIHKPPCEPSWIPYDLTIKLCRGRDRPIEETFGWRLTCMFTSDEGYAEGLAELVGQRKNENTIEIRRPQDAWPYLPGY